MVLSLMQLIFIDIFTKTNSVYLIDKTIFMWQIVRIIELKSLIMSNQIETDEAELTVNFYSNKYSPNWFR